MRSFPISSLVILGVRYTLDLRLYNDEPFFEENNCDGWVSNMKKEIVICDAMSHPIYDCNTITHAHKLENLWLRHEIIHAYLFESGLNANSNKFEQGWATNEEMIDWFAIQLPKIALTCMMVEKEENS